MPRDVKTPHSKAKDEDSPDNKIYWKVSPPSELLLKKLQRSSQEANAEDDVAKMVTLLGPCKENVSNEENGKPMPSIPQSTPIKNFVSSFNLSQSPTPTKSNPNYQRARLASIIQQSIPDQEAVRPSKRQRLHARSHERNSRPIDRGLDRDQGRRHTAVQVPTDVQVPSAGRMVRSSSHPLSEDISQAMVTPISRALSLPGSLPPPAAARSPLRSKLNQPLLTSSDGSDEYTGFDDNLLRDNSMETMLSQYDSAPASAVSKSEAVESLAGDESKLVAHELSELLDVDLDDWQADLDEIMGVEGDMKMEEIRPQVHRLQVQAVIASDTDQIKVLDCSADGRDGVYHIILRYDWSQTEVHVKDYVNLLGEFDESKTCNVDFERNFIILHPDTLISSTHVADGINCLRKAVLEDRVKAANDYTPDLVYGSILHELFQLSLSANDFTQEFLMSKIDDMLIKYLEKLYSIDLEVDVAKTNILEKFPSFIDWAQKYIVARPQNGLAIDHRGTDRDRPVIAITKLLDIEEHIWSPRYGLKGMIDATVQIKMLRRGQAEKTVLVPFELKTGRNSTVMAHRAQTILYTLLMSDRYGMDIDSGLLYYMRLGEVIRVPAVRNELRGLIQARNRLASFVKTRRKLPEMLKKEHECKRCYAKNSCMMYHKALEGGTAETSGVPDVFEEKTAAMSTEDAKFFDHWDKLISLEEGDLHSYRKEIWTMASQERQAMGRCFANMRVVEENSRTVLSSSGVRRFSYKFARGKGVPHNMLSQSDSMLGSQINVGDPIVISTETGQYAMAVGFVGELQSSHIWVSVDRRLTSARERLSGFDEQDNQDFRGIMEVDCANISQGADLPFGIAFRIDKDELTSGMALVRNNVMELFKVGGDRQRRELVVNLRAPRFEEGSLYKGDLSGLNPDQMQALNKVQSATDYALILGMPGTGKTTTIAAIIKTLVSEGKTVLLTSYTHSAVDNILLKLKSTNLKMLRLGTRDKVHPDIHSFIANGDGSLQTVKALSDELAATSIVATTCLGINHLLLSRKRFDYCIVDEASQVTLPVCLGPLRFAQRFVLVGDHNQLPPLIRNKEAREEGLAESLFKRLSSAHPSAVANLKHQYRMNEDIMSLANSLMYQDQLKCGSRKVAEQELATPTSHAVRLHGADSLCPGRMDCWIEEMLLPSSKVMFVDTDDVPGKEVKSTTNAIEATLLVQALKALILAGVPQSEIGVLSLYRSQLRLLSNLLMDYPSVEILTADKFQGRDKSCVLVSFVRSNDAHDVGELLRDTRRVNVSLTRAKSKLVMFGSRGTLSGDPSLERMLKLMQSRGWVRHLSKEAHRMHEDLSSKRGGSPERDKQKENTRTGPKVITADAAVKKAKLSERPVLADVLNALP